MKHSKSTNNCGYKQVKFDADTYVWCAVEELRKKHRWSQSKAYNYLIATGLLVVEEQTQHTEGVGEGNVY